MVLDYEPCDECKSNMKMGVSVIEVSYIPSQDKQPKIQDDLYPTGRWVVIKKDSAERIFGDALNGSDKVFVDDDIFKTFVF